MQTDSLQLISDEISGCFRCSRLVEWRERVGREKRASFVDETYWARGVPGFGDPDAAIVVVGLAPAAHGANRTGRMFTGDRSGEWLYRALFDAGLANKPESVSRDDGLKLSNVYILSAVRCAPPDNKPLPEERENCSSYLDRELAVLTNAKVLVALGAYALDALSRQFRVRPKLPFGHGVESALPDGRHVIASFHPSQQNTFTGKLTREMFDAVFSRAILLSK